MVCPPSSEEKNGKKKAVLQQHGQQPHRADDRAPNRPPATGTYAAAAGAVRRGSGIILGNADGLVHHLLGGDPSAAHGCVVAHNENGLFKNMRVGESTTMTRRESPLPRVMPSSVAISFDRFSMPAT